MTYWGKSNVDWQQRIDFDKLRNDRIKKAHKMLNKYGIGAAIVFNWDSQRWLSDNWNHPYTKHIPWHYILLVKDAGFPYVPVVKGFDDVQVRRDAPWLKDRIVTFDELDQPEIIKLRTWDDASKRWARAAGQIKDIMKKHGVEGLPVSVDYANPIFIEQLQKSGLKVVDGNAWILEADMVKTDQEIELMRMAATLNEAGYGLFIREFRPGMRENEAIALMAKGAYDAGAEYIEGWVTNSGPRSSPRNFNWSDKVVRPGELFSLEACHINYCGYKVCYDRTFIVGGKPNDLQKALYDVTAELHHRVMNLLKPGITTLDIDRTRPFPPKIFKGMDEIKNLRSTWYTNHFGGMGIRWDDAPSCLATEPEVVIEKNMCIAYHSIHCIKDYEGVAIENTYRITDTGCECLTKWPFDELLVVGL
jgi:Xaa-Pro aminopeptidase